MTYPVGTVIGVGFVLVSTERQNGKMLVQCPFCQQDAWKRRSNLTKAKSCGCLTPKAAPKPERIPRPPRVPSREALDRHRPVVEKAHHAFATDFRYGVAMARAANQIRERGRDSSPTL